MPLQPFFNAGSLGPTSPFQPYGLLSYGLWTSPSTYGRYAYPMNGLGDLTAPPSSFGLTSFGDPIAPSFGGLYAGGASTSTLAPPNTSQTYLLFLMLHACFTPITLCFVYTSWHFYAFSGTNLLTRCHSASSLFSAVLCFRKVIHEIFSELNETKPEVPIFP
jgi:hypothetical protein